MQEPWSTGSHMDLNIFGDILRVFSVASIIISKLLQISKTACFAPWQQRLQHHGRPNPNGLPLLRALPLRWTLDRNLPGPPLHQDDPNQTVRKGPRSASPDLKIMAEKDLVKTSGPAIPSIHHLWPLPLEIHGFCWRLGTAGCKLIGEALRSTSAH